VPAIHAELALDANFRFLFFGLPRLEVRAQGHIDQSADR